MRGLRWRSRSACDTCSSNLGGGSISAATIGAVMVWLRARRRNIVGMEATDLAHLRSWDAERRVAVQSQRCVAAGSGEILLAARPRLCHSRGVKPHKLARILFAHVAMALLAVAAVGCGDDPCQSALSALGPATAPFRTTFARQKTDVACCLLRSSDLQRARSMERHPWL